MSRVSGPLIAVVSACLIVLVAIPVHAQIASSDEEAIQQLVARLYDARARKDLVAFSALFSTRAPRTGPRVPARMDSAIMRQFAKQIEQVVFPYERVQLARVAFSRLRQEATSITAVVTADVIITPTSADKPRAERWIRNMGFVKEGETWLIWREATAADDLAVEIGRAKSREEREALLKAQPELLSAELAVALEGQGDRLFTSFDAKGALPFYQLEIAIGEQVASAAAVARAHLKIGQVLQLNPNYASELDQPYRGTAMEHFQKALEGFTSIGDRARMANAEVGMATVTYMKDDPASRDHYQKAIDILETLDDKFMLANAIHGFGNACYVLGDYTAALEAYRRSMSLLESAGSRGGIPALWQAIGRVQKKQGDYDVALESCRRSLADPAYLDPGTTFTGLIEIADVYRLQGRFDLALDEYSKALVLAQKRGDDQGAMRAEADVGNVYMTAQQPGAALPHYQRSIELAQKQRNQDGVARALAGLGSAHFADMRNDAALDAFTKALAIREALKDKAGMAWLHAHIGLVHSASERHEEALASFQKAFALSAELQDRAAVAVMETLLASENADLDHGDQALEHAEVAARLAREIESDDTLARAKVIMARALKKKGDLDAARKALDEAVAAVESGRARTGDDPSDDFFGDTRGPYRETALLLVEGGANDKAADALTYAERSRIDLLASVLTGNRSLISGGLSAEEQEAERQVGRSRRSLRAQIDKEQDRPRPDPARLDSLKTKLAEVERERGAFAERIYAAHPMLKTQRGFFLPGASSDFTRLVDGRTAVVEFVTGEKQTVAIVLTRASAQQKPSTGQHRFATVVVDISLNDLTRRVRDYRAAIRTRDPETEKQGKDLYQLLVAPWDRLLVGRTRLIVVPDGPLWSLPFQALQAPDGRFLIQRCAVSYGPSLTALTLVATSSLAPASGPRTRRVVAVANPQPGSAAERLKLLNAAANMVAMPNAEREARRLVEVYGPARAKIYAGVTANRDTLRADAEAATSLHLATFLVPNGASPLRSPMILSVGKDGQAEVFEAWELMRAAMPPFVVVSRVQVDRVGGDGAVPVGLSWPLFVAGTKTVVLATWPDDSPAAVSLMLALHANQARPGAATAGASGALQRAILPLLATKYRHPFYWANYAVIGVG